jgi:GMP synthase-like glutamine amidotransferase
MKVCILDNDVLDPAVAPVYGSYSAMLAQLLREAGATTWQIDSFHTPDGHYPSSFEAYDAVLLTGSKADSFSQEPWVVELRRQVSALLAQRKKLVGVCFGHQLIAYCMGAPVGRAPQGWGTGRMRYRWLDTQGAHHMGQEEIFLLASHQDQVQALPPGAQLLATSDFCPIAAYAVDQHVLCVQAHPEFVPEYSAFLLHKRRAALGDAHYQASLQSLDAGHDGAQFARLMVRFIEAA